MYLKFHTPEDTGGRNVNVPFSLCDANYSSILYVRYTSGDYQNKKREDFHLLGK